MAVKSFRTAISLLTLLVTIHYAFANKHIQTMKDELAKFSNDRFRFDLSLIRHDDRANNMIKFQFPDSTDVTYEIPTTEDKVIVLDEKVDHLSHKGKVKRVYILLRQTPKDPKQYHVVVAYLRDAGSEDKNAIDVEGTKMVIEWDLWDDHTVPVSPDLSESSLFCASSFLSPCEGNSEELAKHLAAGTIYKAETRPTLSQAGERGSGVIKAEGGHEEDNYDLYRDMDQSKKTQQGRFLLGAVGTLLGGVLGAASGIVCGVLSLLGGCAPPPPAPAVAAAPAPVVAAEPALAVTLRRKKREADVNIDDFAGWKTLFMDPKKMNYDDYESTKNTFVGLGNCPAEGKFPADLYNSDKPEDLITFYLNLLQTQCIPWMKELVIRLWKDEIIAIKDKVITPTPKGGAMMTQVKLNLKETIESTVASQLCALSHSYQEYSKLTLKSPAGEDLSKSVAFMGKLALNALRDVRKYNRNHLVHFTRFMIHVLNGASRKVWEDKMNLIACGEPCSKNMGNVMTDLYYLRGIGEFLRFGLGQVDTAGKDVDETFNAFYKSNHEALKSHVSNYQQ